MQPITATVTFTAGTAVVLSAIPAFAGIARLAVTQLYCEPAAANSHVCYVGDSLLATGTSTINHVIRQLAPLATATSVADAYHLEAKQNSDIIYLQNYSVDGTTNEQMLITVHLA